MALEGAWITHASTSKDFVTWLIGVWQFFQRTKRLSNGCRYVWWSKQCSFRLLWNFGDSRGNSYATSLIGADRGGSCRTTSLIISEWCRGVVRWECTAHIRIWGYRLLYGTVKNWLRRGKSGVHLHCRILHHIGFLLIIRLHGSCQLFRIKICLGLRMMSKNQK